MSKNDSPEDRARKIARAVHRLIAQPDNLREFRRQAEVFKQEDADQCRREQQAEQALQAEGQSPSQAAQAEAVLSEAWNRRLYGPGPNPSLATKFTLLAALHDECLPHGTLILDSKARTLEEANVHAIDLAFGSNPDEGARALFSAGLWCVGAMKGNTERLDALEGYFYEVKAVLLAGGRQGITSKHPQPPLAEQIVQLCDEMLRLGREPGSGGPFTVTATPRHPSKRPCRKTKRTPDAEAVPAVGEHTPMSGPSGLAGRMGLAWDGQWDALAAEFDRRAADLADLVTALDPAYDVGTFYSPQPVSVWEAYPKARKALAEGERKWHRDYELARGKTEAEADALLASLDAIREAQTCAMWTKMQWPGRVMDAAGHRSFLSDPAIVHAFDRRFRSLRAWAAERARQERDQKAAAGARATGPDNKTTAVPPQGKARRRNVRARAKRQKPPPELDEERQRIRVNGKWYDLTDEQTRVLSVLIAAKGVWVQGRNVGKRPDKTIKSMCKSVRRIIESRKGTGYGYRLRALLPE